VVEPFLPSTFLFLSINQAVGSIAVGQSEARAYMALSLLYQEPRATTRRRFKNKEDGIMSWALVSIGTVTALLGILSMYLIWRE
jgi:hypothetical protein